MATGQQAFYTLWQEERIREALFELLPKEDICSVRLANSACCNLVTKRLFLRTHLTFTATSFTRAPRVQALARIGHHIQHLTFSFAHSDATFLPPLVHKMSGEEISFLYTPYTHMTSSLTRPKYANTELGEILTEQYPPLFHAATNVPSFINAVKQMPNMRHLTIKCPGQDARERYRRDIVDYALISLRISLERAPLPRLHKLSLSGVHPSAFNYLRHVPGFGCLPSAARRWRQIRKLSIAVEAWDFYGPSPGLDHLKIIDDYVRFFAPTVEKLTFTWLGRKGPCPLALSGDPLFAPPRSSKKLFNEVTSPMSPLPPAPSRRPMVFPRLRYLTMRNATMNGPQVSEMVRTHQSSVREFDFENVVLVDGTEWDDALAPLTDQSSDRGSDVWSRHSFGMTRSGPVVSAAARESIHTVPVAPSTPQRTMEEVQLPSPSAAVAAVSRELLDLDVEGLQNFLGLNDGNEPEQLYIQPDFPPPPSEEDEVEEAIDDGSLASDIAAAREASSSISTKLTKTQVRRHRKHSTREDDDTETEDRRRRRHRRRAAEDDGTETERDRRRDRKERKTRDRSRDSGHRHRDHRSGSSHSSRHRRKHRHAREERPQTPPPPMPEVILAEDDVVIRESPTQKSPLLRAPSLNISAPMLPNEPLPAVLLLKPAVYDPSSPPPPPTSHLISSTSIQSLRRQPSSSSAALSLSKGVSPSRSAVSAEADDWLSPVKRNLEQEAAHRRLAEDAEARSSALQKAKAAVMTKLTREFCKMKGTGAAGREPGMRCAAEVAAASCAAAVTAAAAGRGSGSGGGGGGGLMGFRLREGLFGTKSSVSIASGHQSFESNTALVPLIFSR